MNREELRAFLDEKADRFNWPGFIEHDPVSIPHLFSAKQDIEIAGLFAATIACGQRITILNNSRWLMERMDHAPGQFVMDYTAADLDKLKTFRHRTFNFTDLSYFLRFLRHHYDSHDSLEDLFVPPPGSETIEQGLVEFHNQFFSLKGAPQRTRKHVATPVRKSACKRLNMFLRWMVRNDGRGVDFGIWKQIRPRQLVCPCDLHVERVARKLGLLRRKNLDWQAALELTAQLRRFDPEDPVKYDFALFGLGVEEEF